MTCFSCLKFINRQDLIIMLLGENNNESIPSMTHLACEVFLCEQCIPTVKDKSVKQVIWELEREGLITVTEK